MDENSTLVVTSTESSYINITALDCPQYDDGDDLMLAKFDFWLEGVVQCSVAFSGLIGNAISAFILTRDEMKNAFNMLLVSLLGFDSWFLVGTILENFRRNFGLGTNIHTLLFPQVLFPSLAVAMTGSIFMTVAISLERYFAVHHPIDYNQSMTNPTAIRSRLLKYLIPVIIFAVGFNVPKFMEATILYKPVNRTVNVTSADGSDWVEEIAVDWRPMISVTDMRKNPYYAIYYNNWARLAVLGIFPALMLIYLNYKIYQDIKHRAETRRSQSAAANTGAASNRRRMEDNLAMVFMGIVTIFFLCHFLRVFLNLHEMIVISQALKCSQARQRSFPMWAIVTNYFSHFLLVVNSSVNMIIYCILNSAFRAEFIKLFKKIAKYTRCRLAQLSRQNSGDDVMGLTQVANISPTNREGARPVIQAVSTVTCGQNGNNQNGNNGETIVSVVLNNGQGGCISTQNGSVTKAETHTAPAAGQQVNEIRPFNANVRVQVSHV